VVRCRYTAQWASSAKLIKTKTRSQCRPQPRAGLASCGSAHYRTETVTESKLLLELVSSSCIIYYNF